MDDGKTEVEVVTYFGKEWRRYPKSKNRTHRVYFQRHEHWKEPPVFLHRAIYEYNFGPIPNGYHIHHKDDNPLNNDPSNLEALSARDHNRITQEEYKNNAEWVARQKERLSSPEWRAKNSHAQKNRIKKELTCVLCGEKFLSRAYSSRFCSECRKMKYCDKNGTHFTLKKQVERFGKVIVPYDSKI